MGVVQNTDNRPAMKGFRGAVRACGDSVASQELLSAVHLFLFVEHNSRDTEETQYRSDHNTSH